MTVEIKIIEEFTDEKKFAKRVENYLNETPDKKHSIHYAVSVSGKGFLYSALIVSKKK